MTEGFSFLSIFVPRILSHIRVHMFRYSMTGVHLWRKMFLFVVLQSSTPLHRFISVSESLSLFALKYFLSHSCSLSFCQGWELVWATPRGERHSAAGRVPGTFAVQDLEENELYFTARYIETHTHTPSALPHSLTLPCQYFAPNSPWLAHWL